MTNVTYFKSFQLPAEAGFQVVAGRPDGLQRLMVVSGRLLADTSGGPVHAHCGDEVLRIISGEVIVRVGNERRTCGAGDVTVVPPNVLHGFQVVQDTVMEVVAEYDIGTLFPGCQPDGSRRLVARPPDRLIGIRCRERGAPHAMRLLLAALGVLHLARGLSVESDQLRRDALKRPRSLGMAPSWS